MTEADYRVLPEEISRFVEVVHGHVIKCEPPVPPHNRIARHLSFALEAARAPSDPCLTIETDVDVVLWRSAFPFRYPTCSPPEQLRRPALQIAAHGHELRRRSSRFLRRLSPNAGTP